jgi:hypothetical protein
LSRERDIVRLLFHAFKLRLSSFQVKVYGPQTFTFCDSDHPHGVTYLSYSEK